MSKPDTMLRTILVYVITFSLLRITQTPLYAQQLYFPPAGGANWETASPEDFGWCERKLTDLYDLLEENGTYSFLVLKNGRIVVEQYFNGHNALRQWVWFSAGKSLRAVLVGIAQEKGILDITAPSSEYLGQGWTSLSVADEARITVRDQLAMTSGLDEQFFACITPSCLRSGSELGAGSRWAYHNGPYNLLKDVLENASGTDINTLTDSYIEEEIGMSGGSWISNGNNTFYVSNARDMARFGLLILNQGKWMEETVIHDSEYFNDMLNSSQQLNPSYGYLWWLNGKESHIRPNGLAFSGPMSRDAPEDLQLAAGAQGQFIAISPSEQLVMIRQGQSEDPDLAALDIHNDIWELLSEIISGDDCEPLVTSTTAFESKEIQVFPVPAKNRLTVKGLEDQDLTSLQLRTLSGKLLADSPTNKIDISEFADGVYFLQITTLSRQVTRRIVKSEF